ncbi:RNA helicase [Pseudogymnoascus verrucosus]|uniref:RNA helicase n=1 Tax=Pseudogymnoascus verrucosus TaxID=342668 RepID=A0A1B8GD82_9PEZI|nr:RNA helicase [Pseudogymnoascus verrucosus]OBT93788.1 RNA helicase [Pseudogymnoascus verrucosus]
MSESFQEPNLKKRSIGANGEKGRVGDSGDEKRRRLVGEDGAVNGNGAKKISFGDNGGGGAVNGNGAKKTSFAEPTAVNGNGAKKTSFAEPAVNGNGAKKTSFAESPVNGNGAMKISLAEPASPASSSVSGGKKTSTEGAVKLATAQVNGIKKAAAAESATSNDAPKPSPFGKKQKPTGLANGAAGSLRPSQRLLDEKEKKIFQERRKLPIWLSGPDIKYGLRYKGNIMLLAGETGSGKSTQVPQFLMNEPWMVRKSVVIKGEDGEDKSVAVGGMIAITEPRRVAAISLAQRVAVETGSYLGPHCNERDRVGYAVRFESNVPKGAKIKFLTEGMLLQELLRDRHLRKYSCVVVDEVHERSVDVDLLLGFLKNILTGDLSGRGGIPLKVVIMSATADIEKLQEYFTIPEALPAPATTNGGGKQRKTNGVKPTGLIKEWIATTSPPPEAILDGDDDEGHPATESRRSSASSYSSWSGLSDTIKGSSSSAASAAASPASSTPTSSPADNLDTTVAVPSKPALDIFDLKGKNNTITYRISGRQHPVSTLYVPAALPDLLEASFRTIFHIHTTEPMPGDILVFLSGQDEIESLLARVVAQAEQLVKSFPRLECTPLFGQLSIEKQQLAFARPLAKNARKCILATNIAETSITVPGVRYVIDTGKAKVKEYRPHLGLQSLLAKPISQSSAIQRRGRAGREAPGKVWRLYTEEQYNALSSVERPEILRADVVEAVLKMKARGIDDIFSFPLLSPPPRDAMLKALTHLNTIGALSSTGELNETGRTMAQFPLSPNYARVLVAASRTSPACLLAAIDAIAVLSGDDIFIQPTSEEARLAAEDARKDLLRREGDVLTQLTTMQKYVREAAGERKRWCGVRGVNARHMETGMSVRRQLRSACVSAGLVSSTDISELDDAAEGEFIPMSEEAGEELLKCFLKAFVSRTAVLGADGAYRTVRGKHVVIVHPSSVMFGRKREAVMFLEHVFTNKNYAKKCSGVQADWIAEVLAGEGEE